MRHRKHLYDVAKQSGKLEDWAAYRSMRSVLECAHNAYCSKLFDDSFSGNRRQFWKYIRIRRKESSGISTLLVNDQFISDPEGKATTLSNQFQSVFTREDLSSVPSLDTINHIPTMPAISITSNGIKNLLCNLDPNKAMGPDKISPYILKYCAAEISPILQIIFTQSLNTGKLPSDLLKANICPVFKKGNRSSPSNYRPISLTSSCCKVLEHIIFHSIMDYIQLNILIDNQHGFRPGFSCQTQLISYKHKALSWSGHITNIASKASQIFNFLRRNLSKCSSTVKTSSYLTLVRPIMEYAASVWDPYHLNDIQALEKVQHRAARWVMNDQLQLVQ